MSLFAGACSNTKPTAVRDFDEERLRGELAEVGPTGFEVERLSLEDAFVEYIGAAERGDL